MGARRSRTFVEPFLIPSGFQKSKAQSVLQRIRGILDAIRIARNVVTQIAPIAPRHLVGHRPVRKVAFLTSPVEREGRGLQCFFSVVLTGALAARVLLS